jgi:hypothetical protein
MRTVGTGLMLVGLFLIVGALVYAEVSSGTEKADSLNTAFYGGIAACVIGAAMFAIRVANVRRGRR